MAIKILLLCFLNILLYKNAYSIDTIYISKYKSTNIICPKEIKLFDIGTKAVQIHSEILDDFTLQLQSKTKENFIPTNLFINFIDGSYYEADICYLENNKSVFKININTETKNTKELINKEEITVKPINENKEKHNNVHYNIDTLLKLKANLHNFNNSSFDISINFRNIFTNGKDFIFIFKIKNNTNINYIVNSIQLSNVTAKLGKLSSNQDVNIDYDKIFWKDTIKYNQEENYIIKVNKIVLSKNQKLRFSLFEDVNIGNRRMDIYFEPYLINYINYLKF